jgi:mono/diheme cytochrome c family protein
VCHGAGGKGDAPAGKSLGAADRTKVVASKSDVDVKAIIEKERSKMPAHGKSLKPAEIDGLIAYIKNLKYPRGPALLLASPEIGCQAPEIDRQQ